MRIDSLGLIPKKDSVYMLERNKKGLIILPYEWSVLEPGITFRDTMFYNPAYLPIVFDGYILPDDLDFLPKDSLKNTEEFHLISPDETLAPLIKRNREVREQRKSFYIQPENMRKIRYSRTALSKIPVVKESDATKKNIFQDLISTEDPIGFTVPELQRVKPKQIYWIKNGEHSLQIAQNYISDNWSKGGNSSYYVRNNHRFTLDYKKDKVSFTNTWEWKLGLQSSSGDTLRDVNINDDLFRMYNVFGYKAFDNWSYSSTLDSKTQLFNTYPLNSNVIKTSFLSPLYVNFGVGMSYNLDKKFKDNITKKLKLSLDISALSLDYRYVGNDKVDGTKFGLKEGRSSQTDYGCKVNAKLDFAFNSFVSWYSEFYYFTTYERVESEFQNKFNFLLNRYLSTTMSLHLRFDDNVPKDDKLGYFQVNEIVSFGLNYKW